jgi:hypothetical protein
MLIYVLDLERIPLTLPFYAPLLLLHHSVCDTPSTVSVPVHHGLEQPKHLCGDDICSILEEYEGQINGDSECEAKFDSSDGG